MKRYFVFYTQLYTNSLCPNLRAEKKKPKTFFLCLVYVSLFITVCQKTLLMGDCVFSLHILVYSILLSIIV